MVDGDVAWAILDRDREAFVHHHLEGSIDRILVGRIHVFGNAFEVTAGDKLQRTHLLRDITQG